MLEIMDFFHRWIRWMERCIEFVTISLFVNDTPTEEFGMKRGLRQGNLLASFLFLVVAERLTGLRREVGRKWL